MARYRIIKVESCNAYFVMRRIDNGWQGVYSYSHKNWKGQELGRAKKAKRRLIQQDKEKK